MGIFFREGGKKLKSFLIFAVLSTKLEASTERCRSGRTGSPGKRVYLYGYRGFESLPLRKSFGFAPSTSSEFEYGQVRMLRTCTRMNFELVLKLPSSLYFELVPKLPSSLYFELVLKLPFLIMSNFQDLQVYQKARVLNKDIYLLFRQYKFDRVVQHQLARASTSIMLNIAEGAGRFSKRDQRNYFVIARASGSECIALFDVAEDIGLLAKETCNAFRVRLTEVSKMLFGMIRKLE